MIRDYLLQKLTAALGDPQLKDRHEWWIIATDARLEIHICLNQKIASEQHAHLMIFNPLAENTVAEMRPSSQQEADQAVQRIAQLIAEHGGGAMAERPSRE